MKKKKKEWPFRFKTHAFTKYASPSNFASVFLMQRKKLIKITLLLIKNS